MAWTLTDWLLLGAAIPGGIGGVLFGIKAADWVLVRLGRG